jgi:hypothetical protein
VSDEGPRPGEGDPETAADPSSTDLTGTLLRLLVGGAAQGADQVLSRLWPPESDPETTGEPDREDSADSTADRARYALIGLLFEAYGVASRGASTAGRLASTTARFWGSILGPVLRSPIVDPVRRPYEFLLERGSQELERWAHIGRAEERRSRELARRLTMIPVDDIVSYLRDHPEMEELVRRQAQSLLVELAEDKKLATVIREQGDRYVDHLHDNPEAIQDLIQSQSVGLASDVADAVRQRTVTADTLLELFVRTVLRRAPREELPEPSPDVRTQAAHPGTRSDE